MAMDKAFADPDFLADASRLGLTIVPTSGAELDTLVAKTMATSPDVIAQMRDLMNSQ
jgi:tripartite-type tricarboxylate transporter receptor subunit TctC